MDLGSSFVVPAARPIVFHALLDPDVMRACIPGCEELERDGERAYRGRLQSEIAHVRFNAAFSATITEFEEPARLRALLQGEDRRIASSIRMDVSLELADRGLESELTYELELALWGRIGRLGEAIVRRRSAEVQQEFEAALLDQIGVVPRVAGEFISSSGRPPVSSLTASAASPLTASSGSITASSGSTGPPTVQWVPADEVAPDARGPRWRFGGGRREGR